MIKTIVITVCVRPFYLKLVLDAWMQVEDVQNWKFLFMVEPTAVQKEQLRLIDEFKHSNKSVMQNIKRLGVLKNPHEGIRGAFEHLGSDFVMLAEEDLLPSVDVLNYMNFAAKEYQDDQEILAACCNPSENLWYPIPWSEIRIERLPRYQEFAVWLWGTWRDRWPLISDTWDFDYSSGTKEVPQSGWDWNLDKRVLPQNSMKCVFPPYPLVDNLGKHMGEHALPEDYEKSRPKGFDQFRKIQWGWDE